MRTVAIIQARMGGQRFPGKVLAEVCGKPLLRHMIERLVRCETLDEIAVAIPDADAGDFGEGPIPGLVMDVGLALGWDKKLDWFCGSEEDVLERVLHAAHQMEADTIVELTADCPLIDPAIVDETVREFCRWHDADYLPTMDFVTTTRDAMAHHVAYPRGMDVRVFPTEVLERVDKLTQDPRDREHVSLYIWEHPDQFAIRHVYAPEHLRDDVRLTVDTPEDLELVRTIFEYFAPRNDFSLAYLLDVLDAHPDWRKINAHVEQKAVR